MLLRTRRYWDNNEYNNCISARVVFCAGARGCQANHGVSLEAKNDMVLHKICGCHFCPQIFDVTKSKRLEYRDMSIWYQLFKSMIRSLFVRYEPHEKSIPNIFNGCWSDSATQGGVRRHHVDVYGAFWRVPMIWRTVIMVEHICEIRHLSFHGTDLTIIHALFNHCCVYW